MTFDDLYHDLVRQAVYGKPLPQEIPEADSQQLDCLLNPHRYAPVWALSSCHCQEKEPPCAAACLFQAIVRKEDGSIAIDSSLCSGCSSCLDACQSGTLTASRDILPALDAVKHANGPVYALIAPAFHGQFSPDVTPGQLRSAFKSLGFTGMVEVALFADILTLKEALEFDHNINTEEDFQLTSCCCPVWIAMLQKVYRQLMPHVPGAVSPMIAAGRTVKALHPDALTIFIGPCLAKKSEARAPDLAGAVDFVLTFQEIRDVFQAADIHPEALKDSEKGHSSRAGRIYARSGGVSEAVQATVARLHPERPIQVRTQQADGIPACKAMIEALQKGDCSANFFEGMGCLGGCVGGPKAIRHPQEGRQNVDRYGDESDYPTPLDNPYVIELLLRLGFETVDDFLAHSDMFVRQF
ncbi:MAG: [Fe-Fe] hydrogenase large subunit C-terminal domain-containing protein [Lawsonibacter sp.]|nr:[Fe-Fe] hydrogenase large subunit C-terminal domain-containing protein [Lawsonibacter sp.]